MAQASGSIAAARGRKTVGESWWMLCLCSYEGGAEGAEGTVGEDEDALKCAAREERRLGADDIVRLSSIRYRYRMGRKLDARERYGEDSGYAQLYKDIVLVQE